MFLCRRRFYSDLRHLKKIGGQWVFGGASDFSNLLAPWASDSRSLMLRAGGYLLVASSCDIFSEVLDVTDGTLQF